MLVGFLGAIDESVPMVITKEIRAKETNKMTRQDLQAWTTRFTNFLKDLPGKQIKNLAQLEQSIMICNDDLELVKSNFAQASQKENQEMLTTLQAVGLVITTLQTSEDIENQMDVQDVMFSLHDKITSGFYSDAVLLAYQKLMQEYAKQCQEIYDRESSLFNVRKNEEKAQKFKQEDNFVEQIICLNNDAVDLAVLDEDIKIIHDRNFIKIFISGDGNCFHRSFWASYLCNAVMQTKDSKDKRINKIIQLLKEKFVVNMRALNNKFLFRRPIKYVANAGRMVSRLDADQEKTNLEKYAEQIDTIKSFDYLEHSKSQLVSILEKIKNISDSNAAGVLELINNNLFDYFMIMFLHTMIYPTSDNDNYWCAWASQGDSRLISSKMKIPCIDFFLPENIGSEFYESYIQFNGRNHFEGLLELAGAEETKSV